MAQTVYAVLVTPEKSLAFTLSATDDAWSTLKDSINTLNLYEVGLGQVVLKAYGAYNVGSGICRIRNTVTNQVKGMFLLTMPKGLGMGKDSVEKFNPPFVVETNDILEAFVTVAGS